MDMDPNGLGRVVDILEASGAFDPGSNPGRGAFLSKSNTLLYVQISRKSRSFGQPSMSLIRYKLYSNIYPIAG